MLIIYFEILKVSKKRNTISLGRCTQSEEALDGIFDS